MTVCPHAPFSQRATWPAERRCSAAFDRRHHLHLAEADVPRAGATPRGAVVAEDVRNLQSWTLHDPRPLRRRLTPATPSGPLTWVLGRRLGKLPQLVERTHDAGDHAGRNTRVARCRLQLVVSERTRAIMLSFYVIES